MEQSNFSKIFSILWTSTKKSENPVTTWLVLSYVRQFSSLKGLSLISLFFLVINNYKMLNLSNENQETTIEDYLFSYLEWKSEDCILHLDEGVDFKIHKEIFIQTNFMRDISLLWKNRSSLPIFDKRIGAIFVQCCSLLRQKLWIGTCFSEPTKDIWISQWFQYEWNKWRNVSGTNLSY